MTKERYFSSGRFKSSQWVVKRNLEPNPAKCNVLTFSLRMSLIVSSYCLGGHEVARCTEHWDPIFRFHHLWSTPWRLCERGQSHARLTDAWYARFSLCPTIVITYLITGQQSRHTTLTLDRSRNMGASSGVVQHQVTSRDSERLEHNFLMWLGVLKAILGHRNKQIIRIGIILLTSDDHLKPGGPYLGGWWRSTYLAPRFCSRMLSWSSA